MRRGFVEANVPVKKNAIMGPRDRRQTECRIECFRAILEGVGSHVNCYKDVDVVTWTISMVLWTHPVHGIVVESSCTNKSQHHQEVAPLA